jgi:rhodanese-related sulfurtransferase
MKFLFKFTYIFIFGIGLAFHLNLLVPAIAKASTKEEIIIIDVRTSEEYVESHAKDALNIDVRAADFAQQIEKLDKNKTYKLYCRSGNRSGKALDIMKSKGFLHVENLGGLKDAIEKLNSTCEGKKPC